ncbi:DUF2184 domain-containing protein (plasmid) [Azospirillum baldaniorum]|uniref:DUF2184 domain-containing protein n=1 Tax=Azospirillum baldaniorum TaxID=1064539 RepID=A0A9P1NRI2_9PROT|nr:major capsid family protein [Azospirillum baldaniorum]AWJ93313.1 DUF2184 domain-containing protein [Azospirillum baldaniorum]TWA78015.1 uncharacterized protein DUF2184 [Azospirillum brasilense]CCD02883.1 conserved protein of unknown function [Azospirillum baldaniorum]
MPIRFNTQEEARTAWASDRERAERLGVYSLATGYLYDGPRFDYTIAMDAQPGLSTDPNSAVPAMLTTLIDPDVFEILFSPTKAAEILGENRKGTWTDDTAMFPVVEHTGEASSYGDFAENGRAGANTNWPQRQSYLFQVMKEYGERELERAGLARINWVSEIDKAAATTLNRFTNLTYFYGVQGLQNYGLLNDPNLSAALTPATKAAGGTAWIAAGVIKATANEVYADIQALFWKLVAQSGGLVTQESKMTLALGPGSAVALTATNTYNVNVTDLLRKNFPNLRVVTAVQYGIRSASNPQGVVVGNLVQLIVDEIEGQDTGYCAYNEKMRAHKIIPATSSYKQKVTGGTWGAIIRMPMAIAQMLGV